MRIRHSGSEELEKTINNLLFKNYDRTKLINYLKEKGVYQRELEPLLDKVDKFIKDKTI